MCTIPSFLGIVKERHEKSKSDNILCPETARISAGTHHLAVLRQYAVDAPRPWKSVEGAGVWTDIPNSWNI